MSSRKGKKSQPYTSTLRGVSALLGETPTQPIGQSERASQSVAEMLSIHVIQLPKSQPRKYFNSQKLEELAQSVRVHGILEPLLVRPVATGRYELVAGERRYRAAGMAGLSEVPAVVKELDEEEALQVTLIENLQREDLNPVEETEGVLQLLSIRLEISGDEIISLLHRMQNESKGKVTQNVLGSPEGDMIQEVFDALGIISWTSFVSARLPLLKLPEELLENLRQGKIAYTKAQAIARVKDEEQRHQILETAVEQELSLSQIKERIQDAATIIPTEQKSPTLRSRMDNAYKLIKRSKIWDNPKKAKKLERLVASIEQLMNEETH